MGQQAVAHPMGLQLYESAVRSAMRRCAAEEGGFAFDDLSVGSLRSPGRPDRRLPLERLHAAPVPLVRALARLAYRGASHVHRFDLRLPPATVPEVLTIHDLPPLRFADEGRIPGWAMRSAGDARLIIVPSEFAAAEVRELLGVERVAVVPNGVNVPPRADQVLSAEERNALGLPTRYVLHVGGSSSRKNLVGLAGAWLLLTAEVPDLSLVSVGPLTPQRRRLLGSLPKTVLTGHLPHDVGLRVMGSALAVVVPSLYEGFGLPALESMSVGTPVVAADRGALPEVCGGAALLVEPSAEAIADGLAKLVTEGELSRSLSAAGRARAATFTWEQCARGHLAAYRSAFG